MRVPLSWLSEYVDIDGADALQVAADLVRVGLEEEAIHGGAVSGPLVVGRVLSDQAEEHRNGKTVHWCSVDVGTEYAAADGGPRGIVCGAHNLGVGDLVVVALPGASLQGFEISARTTYGHVSDGMICSARELGIGEDHDGVIVLPGSQRSTLDLPAGADPQPGDDATALLGLDEQIVEINVTPDRGYCLSVRGVAREYAHATARSGEFRDPAALSFPPDSGDGFPVRVSDAAPIHDRVGCDRFVARVVRGIDPSAPTPAWMRRRLEQAGMRPISLAVDVTNYVMLGVGQPLHAYDLGTLAPQGITVRRAWPGERLVTLDGIDRLLDPDDLLITDGPDGERVIGLAGVMGGAQTEVGPGTRDVLIEAAHFDPVSVARTARRHRLPSEASKRFERGVDPWAAPVAAELVVQLLVEHGGGSADPGVTDHDVTEPAAPIRLSPDLATRLVGVEYPTTVVVSRLIEIGCDVTETDGHLMVTPPSWRPDLGEGADLVEEVARLEGYDQIPSVLPVAPPGAGLTSRQRARRAVARSLVEAGWSEVLSYPFVAESVHDHLGLDDDDPRRMMARLANPLSDEAPFLRTNLLSTAAVTLRRNLSRGQSDLALFELASVTRPSGHDSGEPLPQLPVGVQPSAEQVEQLFAAVPPQPLRVGGIAVGQRDPGGWWGPGREADHGDAIEAALLVARALGVELDVVADQHAPWHPGRCAALRLPDGTLAGHAGELHPRVCENLEIPRRAVAFELDLDVMIAAAAGPPAALPVSPFGVVKEDVALVVEADVPAASVATALRDGGGDLLESVRLFDVYRGEQVGDQHKSLAFALRMRAGDRTLTAAESARVREAAVAAAAERVGAVLRGG